MFKKNNDGFGTIGAIIVLVIAVGLFIILQYFFRNSMREGMI